MQCRLFLQWLHARCKEDACEIINNYQLRMKQKFHLHFLIVFSSLFKIDLNRFKSIVEQCKLIVVDLVDRCWLRVIVRPLGAARSCARSHRIDATRFSEIRFSKNIVLKKKEKKKKKTHPIFFRTRSGGSFQQKTLLILSEFGVSYHRVISRYVLDRSFSEFDDCISSH